MELVVDDDDPAEQGTHGDRDQPPGDRTVIGATPDDPNWSPDRSGMNDERQSDR
jgi:hypothetical protein